MAIIDTRKKNKYFNDTKVNIYIPESYIMNLIKYCYASNDFITKRNLVNLDKLINSIDYENNYVENPTLLYKMRFLKVSIDINLNEKIINNDRNKMLMDYFNNEVKSKYIPKEIKTECLRKIIKDNDLTRSELSTLTEYVENKLSYLFLYQEEGRLEEILHRIKIGSDTKDLVIDFRSMIVDLNKKLNNVASMNEYANKDFSINSNDTLSDRVLTDFLISKRKGDYKLKSGYYSLNQMINGGFEAGRVYMLFGPTKGFKSGTLLNLAVTICRYNKNVYDNLKDPDKTPCVVYFTQENTVKETIDRLSECIFGEEEIKNWSLEKLKNGLRSYTSDINGINLRVIYRPNRSVDTNYLYNICENLELENEECICMIQDYVKRIRSTSNIPDLRLELGEVVNEFSTFAKEKNIPLITAGQLNREATRLIDNFIQNKANDYTKALNASHIGESLLMLENTDYGIIVNREMVEDTKEEFVSFKLIASRAKKNNKEFEYFAQPISSNGGFRIEEDEGKENVLAVKNIGSSLETMSSPEDTTDALRKAKLKSALGLRKQRRNSSVDPRYNEKIEDDEQPALNFEDDIDEDDEIDVISSKGKQKQKIKKNN